MNPNIDWESVAFAPWRDGQRLERLFKRWRGEEVDARDDDGVDRGGLDDWQAFAYDIVSHHDDERVRLEAQRKVCAVDRSKRYEPLR